MLHQLLYWSLLYFYAILYLKFLSTYSLLFFIHIIKRQYKVTELCERLQGRNIAVCQCGSRVKYDKSIRVHAYIVYIEVTTLTYIEAGEKCIRVECQLRRGCSGQSWVKWLLYLFSAPCGLWEYLGVGVAAAVGEGVGVGVWVRRGCDSALGYRLLRRLFVSWRLQGILQHLRADKAGEDREPNGLARVFGMGNGALGIGC